MKLGRILILSVLLSLILFSLSSCDIYYTNRTYVGEEITAESPDGKLVLLFKEWDSWSGTGADVFIYKKDSGKNSMIKLGHIDVDYGYPFSQGKYTIEWGTKRIIIRNRSGRNHQTSDPATWDYREFKIPSNIR